MNQINQFARCVVSGSRRILLVALFVALLPALALATTLTIKSDHLDIWEAKQEALFSGHVHLVREDFELFSDSLHVFYRSGKDGGGIDHALAKGHVRIIQGDKEGSSDSAIIDNRKQLVTLRGHAVMVQEGGRVEGESIVHNIAAKTTEVTQGESGRVTLRIDDLKAEADAAQAKTQEGELTEGVGEAPAKDAAGQQAADVETGQQP
jgi:lipopolysaccharide transport protein LptA